MDKITDLLSIRSADRSNISLSKALLLFYLIVASNFTQSLYSGQLQDLLSNRFAQHVIGFITMLVIIINFAGVTDPNAALLYSGLGYVWFLMTTKLDIQWNLAILALLTIGFLFESKMLTKEIDSDDDQALEEEDKELIQKRHNKTKTLIVGSIMAVTALGMLQYWSKKKQQYGPEFNAEKFVFAGSRRFVLRQ